MVSCFFWGDFLWWIHLLIFFVYLIIFFIILSPLTPSPLLLFLFFIIIIILILEYNLPLFLYRIQNYITFVFHHFIRFVNPDTVILLFIILFLPPYLFSARRLPLYQHSFPLLNLFHLFRLRYSLLFKFSISTLHPFLPLNYFSQPPSLYHVYTYIRCYFQWISYLFVSLP